MRRMKCLILAVLILLTMTNVALGEKHSEIKIDIPLNSTDYPGVIIQFDVYWDSSVINEDILRMDIENAIRDYFIQHKEYNDFPEDYFIVNREVLMKDINQSIIATLGTHDISIKEVRIRGVMFPMKNTHQNEYENQNYGKPVVIYKEVYPNPVWYLVAGIIGFCFASAIFYASTH